NDRTRLFDQCRVECRITLFDKKLEEDRCVPISHHKRSSRPSEIISSALLEDLPVVYLRRRAANSRAHLRLSARERLGSGCVKRACTLPWTVIRISSPFAARLTISDSFAFVSLNVVVMWSR